MKLSIIVPCYNEEGNIKLLYKKIDEILKNIKYEIIFVNDGSKDKTIDIQKEVYKEDEKHVRIINFSRNFGKDAAIYAGLSHAKGKYTVIIDADLQHNPKYLIEMLDFLENNPEYDEVAMINKKRLKENSLTKFLKNTFYKVINLISDTKFVNGASDFRMFNRNVLDAIVSLKENNRFSKGIFSWVGFNTKYLEYEVEERHSGKAFYNFKNSYKYAWEGILNYSSKPIKIFLTTSLIFTTTSLIYLIALIIKIVIIKKILKLKLFVTIIFLLANINLLAISIIGEYLTKIFNETKKRPIYISKEEIGFDNSLL